jgi:hypothetical protein
VTDFDLNELQSADWSEFERRYEQELFPAMESFLRRNGLPHRLTVSVG